MSVAQEDILRNLPKAKRGGGRGLVTREVRCWKTLCSCFH